MTYTMTDLNAGQAAALAAFIELQGKYRWKRQLRSAWESGNLGGYVADQNHVAELQSIRNQFGPMWLKRFKP